jgi:hypothetical protein
MSPAPGPQVVIVQQQNPPTEICAVLSTVFGALGLVFFCFGGGLWGVMGLIMAVISGFRMRGSPGEFRGTGLLVAGTLMSALSLAIAVLSWGMFAALFNPPR